MSRTESRTRRRFLRQGPQPSSGRRFEPCAGGVHVYPRLAIVSDLVRAGTGCGFTGIPLLVLDPNVWVTVALGALFGLFGSFALLTVIRGRMKITLDARAVTVVHPWPTQIVWAGLDGLVLNYYSTDPKKDKGWMHLVLKSGRRRVKVDSRLEGFLDLARQSLDAARANQLTLGASTLANFSSLGLSTSGVEAQATAEREGALD